MAGSSHGHTPAAWTGVTIAFIGFCVAGAFMVMAEPLGFWAGMVVVVLGGVVGWSCARWASASRRTDHASAPPRPRSRREPASAEELTRVGTGFDWQEAARRQRRGRLSRPCTPPRGAECVA